MMSVGGAWLLEAIMLVMPDSSARTILSYYSHLASSDTRNNTREFFLDEFFNVKMTPLLGSHQADSIEWPLASPH